MPDTAKGAHARATPRPQAGPTNRPDLHRVEYVGRPVLGPDGEPLHDADGKPLVEREVHEFGIRWSLDVPTKRLRSYYRPEDALAHDGVPGFVVHPPDPAHGADAAAEDEPGGDEEPEPGARTPARRGRRASGARAE